ncbi:MAG: ammonium transporter, partial [Acidobacteriota bacterium]
MSKERIIGHAASVLSTLMLAVLPGAAQTVEERLATAEAAIGNAQTAGDNAWMLVCSALVLMMTGPGLALFYGGLVRRKNVLATMMQSFIMMAVMTVLWALIGYSLAFAKGSPFIGGLDYAFLKGVGTDPSGYAGTIPHLTFMVFQLMFAIITPALISGAIADRARFVAWTVFVAVWVTLVYFPVAHWVFDFGDSELGGSGAGWLANLGVLDFAGGTAVHINAGAAGLALVI